MGLVVWILVSLLVAAAVFLVANVMEKRDDDDVRGVRAFLRDFRAGLSRRRRTAAPKPVDTDMDAFFAGAVEAAPAYVDADELGDVLQRAQHRVSTPFHGTPRADGDASRA
ncbi:hypothetical protein [Isoptericola halotolerans]|uniref:DivIVA domain-containing protein n=1 Tax=Isoptericola halotolerans TaxID=300560 RepID=A0ABX2A1R2_9MICO|nr:hypothetical protein [Isoptericola halotolerans]NOV96792.1 hypothetical protein [Isoptericola halotolerans]